MTQSVAHVVRLGRESHKHEWKRVPPVVSVVGSTATGVDLGRGRSATGETYNAECECGALAWVHWPTP